MFQPQARVQCVDLAQWDSLGIDGQKCLGRLSKQRCIRLESNQSCKTKCELDLGSINISYLNLQISVFFFSFAHRKEIDDH